MHKAEQDRRLIQFLMGLNEVYTVVRGSFLMMNPLPSMAQAFALLIQEENLREFKPRNQLNFDSATLNVNVGGRTFKTNYSPSGNQTSNSRPRPFCDHCRRPGHTKDRCYKLHGYPQGFGQGSQQYKQNSQGYNNNMRSNKGKSTVANAVASVQGISSDMLSAKAVEPEHQGDNQNMSLSKEQYGQILSLLQHFQVGNGGESNSSVSGRASVNFAGMIACTSSIDFDNPSYKCFNAKADLWILDSGASDHMAFDKTHLQNTINLPYHLLVKLPNGYKVKAPSLKRPLQIVHCLSHPHHPTVNNLCNNKDSASTLLSSTSLRDSVDLLWHY
ncbi:PREDICTED: uncharacterized protein LOC109244690 [Nicotiana attenuata]|uniref:uncharacterized protein LOC109244690 n=1 Tax=Nicotiana attenuata TaxID=49451 RepID=UPI0009047DB4|nr:PREDICTED: uncharacterized protein LOC109244690 [Nicotiana attenuata]